MFLQGEVVVEIVELPAPPPVYQHHRLNLSVVFPYHCHAPHHHDLHAPQDHYSDYSARYVHGEEVPQGIIPTI